MKFYPRQIPRDLFNEASLLKMMGQVCLELENVRDHNASLSPDQVKAFDIEQDPATGSISVTNLTFTVSSTRYALTRPLNSREPWPLYLASINEQDDFEEIAVFDENGSFSDEMVNFITSPATK